MTKLQLGQVLSCWLNVRNVLAMVKSSPKSGRSIDYHLTNIRLSILGQGFECTVNLVIPSVPNPITHKKEDGLSLSKTPSACQTFQKQTSIICNHANASWNT